MGAACMFPLALLVVIVSFEGLKVFNVNAQVLALLKDFKICKHCTRVKTRYVTHTYMYVVIE